MPDPRHASDPTIDVSNLRKDLRAVLDAVTGDGQRRVVVRHGKPVAAVVPLGELEALKRMETRVAAALGEREAGASEPAEHLSVDEAMARRAERRGEDAAAVADVQPEEEAIGTGDLQALAAEYGDNLMVGWRRLQAKLAKEGALTTSCGGIDYRGAPARDWYNIMGRSHRAGLAPAGGTGETRNVMDLLALNEIVEAMDRDADPSEIASAVRQLAEILRGRLHHEAAQESDERALTGILFADYHNEQESS